MPPRYQLVIFDFDGTLADSFPWFSQAFNEIARRYRFRQLDADQMESLRTLSSRQILAELGVPLWKLPLIARYMRQSMAREIDQIIPFPGVEDLLRDLDHQGITIGLVTSNSAANVRQVLGPETASLIRYYGCNASLLGKRRLFRRMVRATGVPRDRVLCIGDELRDLEAARAEGLAFGAVAWGYTALESLKRHRPEEVFHTMDEISECFR